MENKALNKEEMEKIEKQTSALLKQNGYDASIDPYVDIMSVVQSLGFDVGNANLKEDNDGFLIIQQDKSMDSKIIGVNSTRSLEWKRFIIAHEFAHSILHYTDGKTYLHRENKKGKNKQENEADYFAAAILMPREEFCKAFNKLQAEGMNRTAICLQLSSMFKVPLESVGRRIEEVF